MSATTIPRRTLLLAGASASVSAFASAAHAQTAQPAPAQTGSLLITGATLHRVSAPPLVRGQMLVEAGRIVAIAAEGAPLPTPRGALTRLALDGQQLYPGLVAANTQLGLVEVPTVRGTVDTQEQGPLNANAHALVALSGDSELIAVTRAEGVLTVEVAPVSPRVGGIAGRSGVVQLDGWAWPDMALRAEGALHVHLPRAINNDPDIPAADPSALRRSVHERLRLLDEAFQQARAYAQARSTDPQLPRDLRLEALAPYAAGQRPVFIHASEAALIRQALALIERHQLQAVLVGSGDIARLAPLLKARNVAVIVDGVQELPLRRDDAIDQSERTPALLALAGVRFAIARQGGIRNAPNVRNLAHEAAAAVAHGLAPEAALRAITLSAAELLGVADQVGSLDAGKLATFFVTQGDVLEVATRVERVFVRGRELDVGNRQQRLMEKYQRRGG